MSHLAPAPRRSRPGRTRRLWIALAAGWVAAIGSVAGRADAAPMGTVPWATPDGSGPGFTFSDGRSNNGRFGDPVLAGNRLVFEPPDFTARATDGGVTVVDSTLFVTIVADPGRQIGGIVIREIGDFVIARGGLVDAFGLLVLTDLDDGTSYFDALDATATTSVGAIVPLPLDAPGGTVRGMFDGTAVVDLPDGVTRVSLVFNNVLTAIADAGGSAFIQKKVVSGGVGIEVLMPGPPIPEPASAAVLFAVVGALAARRRR